MMADLDISFHTYNDSWKARLKPYQKTIRNILEAAVSEMKLKAASKGQKTEIAVVLADDAFVKDLNNQYRGKNKPTNVLSFPDGDFAVTNNLGDIVLAYETIQKEALEQGKTFRDHAAHLLVHGFLHLLGHDHLDEKEAAIMENKEINILKKLGINNPYL